MEIVGWGLVEADHMGGGGGFPDHGLLGQSQSNIQNEAVVVEAWRRKSVGVIQISVLVYSSKQRFGLTLLKLI